MPGIDTGDTAWILGATALVMFMTPGLALFYGGLVRAKNVLGTIMQSFAALALVTVLWVLIGYTLAFGPDKSLLIGGLDFLGLTGVGQDPVAAAPTVPHLAFMAFQMMFAVITPALIAGAFAERMRFGGYVLFIGLWSVVVYAPLAHWVWGGGWLGAAGVGALDFAGGTVVHINAGIAALVAAIYLGKRKETEAFVPHNVPMVITGAAILWFGWFGFNAGSALSSGGLAAQAFVTTHVATAAAVIGWLIPEWRKHGKPTTVGAATGAVAGLVAITPAAGFVAPWAAVLIGLVAGAVCYAAVGLKFRFGYDDSLDVVGVHMVGGIAGALLTGVFAQAVINPAGADGLLFGNAGLIGKQLVAVVATLAYSGAFTFGILKVVDLVIGLRVSEEGEAAGLDLTEHAEAGYTLGERAGTHGVPDEPVILPAPVAVGRPVVEGT